MRPRFLFATAALVLLTATTGWAQTDVASEPPTASADSDREVSDGGSGPSDNELLSAAELQTLVAPVALYPDTLLIQILVAATQPLEIVKSQRFLVQNADADPGTLKDDIDAQGWDESVAVLAAAFPDVIDDMAVHLDWTETVGDAMLAQDQDVLDAVQVMRSQAIDSGALLSGDAQTVETDENDDVIIEPTDPNVVYVPQYQPSEVYAQPTAAAGGAETGLSDALIGGAIGFGTYAVMDSIFGNDDDRHDYWGCRNCGGWDGGPIVRNPEVDIDVDGNVNIGNRIKRRKTNGDPVIGDGSGKRPDIG